MFKYLSIIFIILVFSCDISREDYIPITDDKEENKGNSFYTLPTSNLTINPTAFENLKDATSLIISQLPTNGEAKFIENGYVFYRLTNSQATDDSFVLGGKTNAGTLVNETIKINIVQRTNDLPCFAGTLGDNVETNIEKAIEIPVMNNDKTCSSIGTNALSIEIPPKNGKVNIVNQQVVYTPNTDFMGNDIFYYRVAINTKKNPVAPVEISVVENSDCVKGLTDDIINVLSYTANSNLAIDVLQNDNICSLYKDASLKILTNSTTGTLRVDKNNDNKQVIYFQSANPPKGQQSFEYALYRSEKIYVKAKVSINFN